MWKDLWYWKSLHCSIYYNVVLPEEEDVLLYVVMLFNLIEFLGNESEFDVSTLQITWWKYALIYHAGNSIWWEVLLTNWHDESAGDFYIQAC